MKKEKKEGILGEFFWVLLGGEREEGKGYHVDKLLKQFFPTFLKREIFGVVFFFHFLVEVVGKVEFVGNVCWGGWGRGDEKEEEDRPKVRAVFLWLVTPTLPTGSLSSLHYSLLLNFSFLLLFLSP